MNGFGDQTYRNSTANLNVGDTEPYIKEYDASPTSSARPRRASSRRTTTSLAKVIFTSLNDDNAATTSYFDPISQTTTTIVAPWPRSPAGSGRSSPR